MITMNHLDVHQLKGSTLIGKVGYDSPVSMRLFGGEVGVMLGGKKPRQVIQLIMNMGTIDQGEIGFFGNPSHQWTVERSVSWRRKIGFAFREMGLLSNLNIFDNVNLPARYHGYYSNDKDNGQLAEKALRDIAIPKGYWKKLPINVPDEIQKKALLARAVVLQPSLLILDDPAALFPWSQLPALIRWIKRKKENGTACLISTDHYPFGITIADWVLIPDFSPVDYCFKDNLDPSWVRIADILMENVEHNEAVS